MKNIEQLVHTLSCAEFGSPLGTDGYHKIAPTEHLLASDGVIEQNEKLNTYWFTTMIWSYYKLLVNKHKVESLCVAYFILDKDSNSGTFYITDGNYNVMEEQEVPYTDCTSNLRVFLAPISLDPTQYLIYMPREH